MRFTGRIIPTVKVLLPATAIVLLMMTLSRGGVFPLTNLRGVALLCPQATSTCNAANSVVANEANFPTWTPRFQFFLHPPGKDLYISDVIYASGGNTGRFYEAQERESMLRSLEKYPGAEILDIGANIGTHTLFFGLSGYKVHAFEPLKASFQLLECSVRTNNISNIILNNVALGPNHGNLCMDSEEIDGKNYGGAHLTNVNASDCDPTNAVKVIPLGEYLELNNIKPTFIKIDVEGFEFNALSTAKDWLRKYPPKHIYSEFSRYNMGKVGSAPNDYWNFLEDLGYKVYNTDDTVHYKSLQEMPDTSMSIVVIHAVHRGL